MPMPETRYARCGDLHLAFQAFGAGIRDVVFVPEAMSHVEAAWDQPRIVDVFERLASFARVVVFDQRGCGLSDPTDRPHSVESWLEDVETVIDAADAQRPSLVGIGSGAIPCLLYAARHPDRVDRLVLLHGWARLRKAPGYDIGLDDDLVDIAPAYTESTWGSGDALRYAAPEHMQDPDFVAWYARFSRVAASPGTARRLQELSGTIDVRAELAAVTAPTLVLHREGLVAIGVEHAEYLNDELPNATLRILPGSAALFFTGNPDEWLAAAESFITGTLAQTRARREVTTLLACDIVSSTEHAASVGDASWRTVLDRHDRAVERQINRFGGRNVETTGDEVTATFATAGSAIDCARAIREVARAHDLEVRAGVHTGEVDVNAAMTTGLALDIARAVMSAADPGMVLVSRTVAEILLGSDIALETHAPVDLAAIGQRWALHRVVTD